MTYKLGMRNIWDMAEMLCPFLFGEEVLNMKTITGFNGSVLIDVFEDRDNKRYDATDRIEVGTLNNVYVDGAIAIRAFEDDTHSHVNLTPDDAIKLGKLLNKMGEGNV